MDRVTLQPIGAPSLLKLQTKFKSNKNGIKELSNRKNLPSINKDLSNLKETPPSDEKVEDSTERKLLKVISKYQINVGLRKELTSLNTPSPDKPTFRARTNNPYLKNVLPKKDQRLGNESPRNIALNQSPGSAP